VTTSVDGIHTGQRKNSLNAHAPTEKNRGRDNEDLMQERVFRGLVRQASTDLRFSRRSRRLCGPLISGVRRMTTANFPRSDTWKIPTCDLLFSVCTRHVAVSNLWRRRLQTFRLMCRMAAPLLKRLRLHVSGTSTAPFGVFHLFVVAHLRLATFSCAVHTSPAVLPVQPGAPTGRRAGCLRVERWALGPRTAVTVSRPHGL
jgi:hypothetical protein